MYAAFPHAIYFILIGACSVWWVASLYWFLKICLNCFQWQFWFSLSISKSYDCLLIIIFYKYITKKREYYLTNTSFENERKNKNEVGAGDIIKVEVWLSIIDSWSASKRIRFCCVITNWWPNVKLGRKILNWILISLHMRNLFF